MEDRSGRLILVALIAALGFALIIGFAFWPGAEDELSLSAFAPLDAGFGDQGRALLDLEHEDRIVALEAMNDGRIAVVANLTTAQGGTTPAVVMLDARGSRIEDWGSAGRVPPGRGDAGSVRLGFGREGRARAAALQPDGAIVIVGDVRQEAGSGHNLFVARLTPDGLQDGGFDEDGWIEFDHGHGDQSALDVVALDDGRLLVGGWARMLDENRDIALLRLLADGRLDTSFGTGGLQTSRYGIRSKEQSARALLVVERGEILALGRQQDDPARPAQAAAARFLSAGAPDPTFGERGHRAGYLSDPDGSTFTAGLVDASGAALAGGRLGPAWSGDAATAPGARFTLLRLLPTGEIDPTYNGDALRIGVDGLSLGALDLAGLADGRTLALTGIWDGGVVRPLLLALRPDGDPDRDFAENGRALIEASQASSAGRLALQALDDRPLVAVEVASDSGGSDILILRLDESPTFGLR